MPNDPETPATPQTPNDLLAAEVVDALVEGGLITDAHKDELFTKLKAGGVAPSDWYQWVDMATAPEDTEEEADDE
jgi:hypothetical protein